MAEMLSRYIALLWRGDRMLPLDYADRALRDRKAEREYYSISPDLDSLVDWNAFLDSVARRVGCESRLPLSCVLAFNAHMFAVLMLVLQVLMPVYNILGTRNALLLWTSTLASFFFLHDGLMIKWWFYPHWPVWYRRRGPDADPALFDSIMAPLNIWKRTAMTRGFVLLIFWSWWTYYAQRLLSVFVFMPYKLAQVLGIRIPRNLGGFLMPKIYALHDAEWRFVDLFLP